MTPLHLACSKGYRHIEIIRCLVNGGADVTIKTREGETAFDMTFEDEKAIRNILTEVIRIYQA